jgi:glycosyltransferase involved in cell wall biosynthesis
MPPPRGQCEQFVVTIFFARSGTIPLHSDIVLAKKKMPVSICIIAGNEAARISRALESVASWAGEIIVVINDDVSDGTDKIAESFGVKVFREPWKGHIAQKNSAADKATQPWILGLDADEEISPALRDKIRCAMDEPGDRVAYGFPRCTQFCGRWIRHGDWYPDWQTRLWRKGQARWGGADPHDKLIIQGRVGWLRSDLLHYNAEMLDRQIAKISSYSDAFARGMLAQNRRADWSDIVLRPLWRFCRGYVLRLGFLDGWQGAYIAWMTAFYTATRYVKVRLSQTASVK